ncbi:uncharacterized protein BX663DRAFT_513327 [Cokeromyces recurvatus]|uniref:uncharacterized protein n=1 Tax=Cokeromyces recurvatus TaxID=90255 RepID=UPI00221E626F|nr:uncharacterized protein BX663DRAFT_513327 [Cokeromyces recurvatus]KAI7901572.1 hypothetical protein BX663DRAFT_513327 [Cokeromyces recurvatus]
MEHDHCQHILKALGAFDYAAATKLIAKLSKIYQPFSYIFTRLCSCESSFTQLLFLRSRWFVMRKDIAVETVYTNLANELPREILNVISTTSLSNDDKSQFIIIMDALTKFCQLRREMINLYQAILAQSMKGEFDEILKELESVQEKMMEMNLQKDLDILGLGIEKEIGILTCILRARLAITNYAFQDACIALFQTKQDLYEWKRICQEQDYPEKSSSKPDEAKEISTWRFHLFGQSESKLHHKQGDIWPNTIRWHARVLHNLTAKMTLFFYTILLEKERLVTEEDPEKSLWKGLKVDYYEQIATFKRKFGAYSISLVYEVTNDTPFYPQGYVCSSESTPYEPPQGIHSFPFIFCYPKDEIPTKHLPNIISIIQQGSKHHKLLSDPKSGPIHFFDNTVGSNYYLMRIDKHTVMVIIYLDKHSHREPSTIEFMTNIVTSLRGSIVIEELINVD